MTVMLPFQRLPLARFLRPASVAVIGDDPAAAVVLASLRAGGFAGPIHAAATPDDLPETPDLAVVATPAPPESLLAGLAARGTPAAILTGPAPVAPGPRPRFLGGHALGVIAPAQRLNASLVAAMPKPGPLALVGQSRGFARAVLDHAAAHGLGFRAVIGLGRNDDLGFTDALDWLSRDPGTSAILLEVSRIKNRRGFLSAARAAARGRAVVAIRTAPDAAEPPDLPEDAVFAAALRRAGILCVEGLDPMLAALSTLTRAGPLRGERIAVVSGTRALAALAGRALSAQGIALPPPPAAAAEALGLLVPPGNARANPLIIADDAPPNRLAEVAAALAGLPGAADAVIAVHVPDPDAGGVASPAAEALATASAMPRRVPLLAVWPGESGADRRRLDEAGIPAFPTPERAAAAAALLVEHRRAREAARELPPRTVLAATPDRESARRVIAGVRRAGRLTLTEDEAFAVLAAYGIPTVPSRVARDPASAGAAAAALGFPCVLKIRSPDLPHKTAVGGVALDLDTETAVRAAAEAMAARVARRAPEARLAGFLVQRQVGRRDGQEIAIRLGRDRMFGAAIGFGLGGTASAVLGDQAVGLPPLNLALAGELIGRSRVAALLGGYRDRPAVDRAALAEVLARISQLAVDWPEIAALDVNPLMAGPSGVMAVDAWIALDPAPVSGTAHLAIAPYPAELEESVRLLDGRTVTLRPIRPEDAEAHAAFFAKLSPEDVRRRFFAPIAALSAEQIARMTQIDYDREMAFIATAPGPDGVAETLGVVRIVREAAEPSGEFAVVVRSDLKWLGLGKLLMEKAIGWARAQGLRAITGEVLAENRPMLRFVEKLGFTLARHPDDPELLTARLEL
ncbi:GNAT family N-acetyltransferase [Elioraea tepidiphila]|uniref:bifunctional acetate--CoA ligase family protein/GNAT family N-acetyltransferase n=1 Tax=Elioraea tepidiphila TaxID=457934 RepID=UPI0012EC0E29|nr:GNAT family N-acetyltransferase [Elioraea tepidiphila]